MTQKSQQHIEAGVENLLDDKKLREKPTMKNNHTKDEHSDVEGIVEEFENIMLFKRELSEGFERPVGSEPSFVKEVKAEHLGDVASKLVPEARSWLRTTLTSLQEQHERREREVVKETEDRVRREERKILKSILDELKAYSIHRSKMQHETEKYPDSGFSRGVAHGRNNEAGTAFRTKIAQLRKLYLPPLTPPDTEELSTNTKEV